MSGAIPCCSFFVLHERPASVRLISGRKKLSNISLDFAETPARGDAHTHFGVNERALHSYVSAYYIPARECSHLGVDMRPPADAQFHRSRSRPARHSSTWRTASTKPWLAKVCGVGAQCMWFSMNLAGTSGEFEVFRG